MSYYRVPLTFIGFEAVFFVRVVCLVLRLTDSVDGTGADLAFCWGIAFGVVLAGKHFAKMDNFGCAADGDALLFFGGTADGDAFLFFGGAADGVALVFFGGGADLDTFDAIGADLLFFGNTASIFFGATTLLDFFSTPFTRPSLFVAT